MKDSRFGPSEDFPAEPMEPPGECSPHKRSEAGSDKERQERAHATGCLDLARVEGFLVALLFRCRLSHDALLSSSRWRFPHPRPSCRLELGERQVRWSRH